MLIVVLYGWRRMGPRSLSVKPVGGNAQAMTAEYRPRRRRSDPCSTTHLGPVRSCPGCGGADFLVEEQREGMVFHCTGCDQRWRYELGYVWPVAAPAR